MARTRDPAGAFLLLFAGAVAMSLSIKALLEGPPPIVLAVLFLVIAGSVCFITRGIDDLIQMVAGRRV